MLALILRTGGRVLVHHAQGHGQLCRAQHRALHFLPVGIAHLLHQITPQSTTLKLASS